MGSKNSKIKLGVVLFLVILIGITIKPSFRLKAKRPFRVALNPIREKLKATDSFLLSLENVVINFNRWEERLTELQQEKIELLAENAKLQEVRQENESLREALEVELQDSFELKTTRVIGVRPEQNLLIINKGSKDEIEEGMSVVDSNKALAGEIIEVGKRSATVRLITHPETSFSAHLKNKEAEAEIRGLGHSKVELDLIPADQEVSSGEVVVTSALGGSYPAGLLVGEVEKVEKKDVESFQIAEVQPHFDKTSSYLFVITDY